MTPLQEKMMNKIALSEYTSVNGNEPSSPNETITWAEMIIETPEDKGVFTSLLNQGLVFHTGGHKQDAVVGLTIKGFGVFQDL